MMDLEPQKDGRLHFSLGPVERWVVATLAAVLLGAGYWVAASLTSRLDEYGKSLASLGQQQAVTNSQLSTLNLQLSDVPSLSRRQAEHEVRIKRVEDDVRELRQTRGAR